MTKNEILSKISKKLDQGSFLTNYGFPCLGFIFLSPISYYLAQGYLFGYFLSNVFAAGVLSKITGSLSGYLGGRYLGDYYQTSNLDFDKLIYHPDLWNLIIKNIDIPKLKSHNLEKNKLPLIVIDYLNDSTTEIGALYYFISIVFIERFNYLNKNQKNIMEEIKLISELLTIKHPCYPYLLNKTSVNEIIKKKLLEDFSSYITFFYSLHNHENNKMLYQQYYQCNNLKLVDHFFKQQSNMSNNKQIVLEIINSASPIFRSLASQKSLEKKSVVLSKTIEHIDQNFKDKINKNMACDDLLPLLILLVLNNWDIFPSNDINMLYDYLQDNTDKEGYISTIMMSAVFSSVQLTKQLKN